MKPVNLFFLTFLIFSITISAFAQPPYPEWKQYLPVDRVGIMKLSGNTLYATSYNSGYGLVALDLITSETQVYSEYSHGLASDIIMALDIDPNGDIWLGHFGHGVSRLSGDQCTIFNTENSGLINNYITTLCVDLNGQIWIGSWTGISKYDGQEWQTFTSSNSDLPNDTVNVIVVDNENNKWIGIKRGFVVYDENNWEHYEMFTPSVFDPTINNIIIDENGIAWIDARQYNSGLFKFDGDTIINMNWPPPLYNYITDFDFDGIGNLWVSISSGMNEFGLAKYNGVEFIEYDLGEMADYLSNHSHSIEIDWIDNKWIGSWENGLLKYKDGDIEQINDGILGLHYPYKLAVENNNRIWITNSDGVTEYNSGTWNFFSKDNSNYPTQYSYCIAIDENGKKWIGANDELIKYDDEDWFVYDSSNSPISYGYHIILNIVIDKNDIKWFTHDGLYKFDNENWNVYTTENSPLPSNNIYSLAVDSSGIVWLGHPGIGVSSFDGEEWNLFDTVNVGSQILHPLSVYVDSMNTKWICTSEGLLSFDGSSWSVFDTSNTGLPSNYTRSCLFDNNGKLWVGTINGIGVYNGDTWMIYDTNNSSLKRNEIKHLYKSENNTIWIIHQDGLSVYNENGFLAIEEYPQDSKLDIQLQGNPNPFSSVTNICFKSHKTLKGELVIYNLMGQKIKTIHQGFISSGENNFMWDGTNDNGARVENGIYFCQLNSTKPVGTCKIILMRK